MVEIQEPSDLVVRFEFERAGYVLPEASRFMGRDLEFSLKVFNLAPLTLADVDARVRCQPRRLSEPGSGSWRDELIGEAQTDCFRVTKTHLGGPVVRDDAGFAIAIVTAGGVMIEAGGEVHRLNTYDKVLFPAGIGPVKLTPTGDSAEILECLPPA
jgi:mannose-6-phosphate isomerase